MIWPVAEKKVEGRRYDKNWGGKRVPAELFFVQTGAPLQEVKVLAEAVLGVVALGRDLETRKKALGRAMRILWDSG